MAGRGVRFGCQFKHFLKIGNETFIEASVRPFRKWRQTIDRFVFVCLAEQNTAFRVKERLEELFSPLNFEVVCLPAPTCGPAETVGKAVYASALSGPAIVCDCDHAVDVTPLFRRFRSGDSSECLLPIWEIRPDEVQSWAVAVWDETGCVTRLAEKRWPARRSDGVGVIGCYYFRSIEDVARRCLEHNYECLSEVICDFVAEGLAVQTEHIYQAEFFGNPHRLHQTLAAREIHHDSSHGAPVTT